MKITAAILTSAFIIYVLAALVAADRSSETTSSLARDDQQRISDLGLRFAWHR